MTTHVRRGARGDEESTSVLTPPARRGPEEIEQMMGDIDIEPSALSHHAAVILTLRAPFRSEGSHPWRLRTEVVAQITKAISTYLEFNDTADTPLPLLGVVFGGEEYTIAHYADDDVVTLDAPLKALPAFLEEVGAFGAVSGFQAPLKNYYEAKGAVPSSPDQHLRSWFPSHRHEWHVIPFPKRIRH
ncbi:hypothetical protein NDU88_001173 [Pleurodeles waltl]|uniref:Uncharacterized protein n=1 Tax=Pleurodeles waltl TaxID=8319 RepID=A0AAV7MJS3_PLEWA|nr:hypothetical protein NDU88_001173 [Pleurodeles waltl]